jgi:MFS family permease
VLATYRAALRAPGAVAFSTAAFVMRMPMAIYPLAIVLLISSRSGHYAFAGVLAGAYVIANGIGSPVLGRVADRLGQGRVLFPASAAHLVAVLAIGVLAHAGAPEWTLLAPTALAGFTILPAGSLVRARWSHVLAGRPELSTAYSLESILDEAVFTVGPLIASVCATLVDPLLGVGVGAVLVAGGAVLLRRQHASAPPPHAGDDHHRSPLRSTGMVLLCLVAVAMGVMFSSAEVTMVAFCSEHGQRGLSGPAVAAFAAGSGVSGFVYGSRNLAAPVLDRFRTQIVIFAVLPALFLAAVNVPVLMLFAFVVGMSIAPALITAFGLVQSTIPARALTEGLSWVITGISLGWGAGSVLVGGIADAHGARLAFTVTAGAGRSVGVLGAGTYRRIARRPAVAVG